MAERELPSIDYLRQRLRYEPDTGKLFWRARDDNPRGWNERYAGTEALATVKPCGHKYGTLGSCKLLAHRVVWALCHGEWPTDEIDHINQQPADNRIENLRVATKSMNMRNVARTRANTSGVTGVVWHKRKAKWHARIKVCGKEYSLGYHDRLEDAAAARKRANEIWGFHPNHGSERFEA